ncbi:hypothetical protein BDW22DRAFT_1361062 [Trametopsis cervina]|nr:hypothetical protein BDW22DRAFT_1361062 [Trametopsis cervina]
MATQTATHTHVADELPPPEPQHNTDPSVAALKGMFPDFDDTLLESVLASVDHNQDAAVDLLLGMSDPSYVSTQQPPQPQPTSLELDEALARQLQLEDDRNARGQQQPPRATGQSWPRRPSDDGQVPYAARTGQPHNNALPGAGPAPDFNEIKETFNQIAESGKRTFSSIFSKVKAKINELDTNRTGQAPPTHPPPSWGGPSNYDNQGGSAATAPSYLAENGGRMDRHSASQYYGSQYADGWQRVGGGRGGVASQGVPPPVTTSPPPTQPPAISGYDVSDIAEPAPAHAPPAQTQPPPVLTSMPEPSIAPAAAPSTETPRPPTTQSGSPLDATKFGLLPKRPVSLLSPQVSAQRPKDDDEDEDELDYVENPFEEKK